jgi:hypothetical protein
MTVAMANILIAFDMIPSPAGCRGRLRSHVNVSGVASADLAAISVCLPRFGASQFVSKLNLFWQTRAQKILDPTHQHCVVLHQTFERAMGPP